MDTDMDMAKDMGMDMGMDMDMDMLRVRLHCPLCYVTGTDKAGPSKCCTISMGNATCQLHGDSVVEVVVVLVV
ncbi:GH19387 [Drosophila grimshawi]|uniref:GH19387 n=1 Tax=Drosophila grimshawi TaxID=7222 RepID=B4JFT1_DROGR|nr:GH19387 [Drosophila grimshawi]